MRPNLLIALLLVSLLFLAGCDNTILIRNANIDQVVPIFKDYVGIHGYQITYQNAQTGSYRLSLGTVYVPNASQTTKTKESSTQLPAKDQPQTMTSYEETTWQTVSVPGHYVEATAMVRIVQDASDVRITIQGDSYSGMLSSSLSDIREYIQEFGYTVDQQ